MAILNYQMQFLGLVFGLGTSIGIESISGFEDFESDVADTPIPREWGDIIGLQTVASKEVILELVADTDDDLNTILTVFQPSETATALTLREPHGGERFVYARSVARVLPKNPTTKFKRMVSIRLKCANPRLYGDEVIGSTGVYSAELGGMDYDITDYGKDYVGATVTNDLLLTNLGSSRAYPVIILTGPQDMGTITEATVTNLTTGVIADFHYDAELLEDDIFTADMHRLITAAPGDTPYVHLNGTNRYGNWQLARTPFYLAPGQNAIRYEITGTSTDTTMSLRFRHTSL